MIDWFVQEIYPKVQYKVQKDNLSIFLDACVLAERVGHLDNYLGETYSNSSCKSNGAVHDSKRYIPMDLNIV